MNVELAALSRKRRAIGSAVAKHFSQFFLLLPFSFDDDNLMIKPTTQAREIRIIYATGQWLGL
jgi:hypothetical protein